MKTLKNEEMIDLGAISVETRGIKQLGEPDFEDGDHYGLSNGVQKGPPIGVEEGPPFRI